MESGPMLDAAARGVQVIAATLFTEGGAIDRARIPWVPA
jgi:hypothetical protein